MAGVSIAKKGIQSLISHTLKEGNRTADILQHPYEVIGSWTGIYGRGGFITRQSYKLEISSLMGFTSAVEAWFVTASSVDSNSANLKGNPGLALAAKIMGVIESSASMRLPANCHPLSRLLNFRFLKP
ncbi:hypothetical protein WN943_029294 [Citrus x changshan-huyou]